MHELINRFLSGLSASEAAALEVRKIYEPHLALEFNPVLQFFRIDENKLSEIIAFFLDSKASHGQGDIFLREFLRLFFGSAMMEYSVVEVECEHRTYEHHRLDVCLNFDSGRFGIGIENKIWARDQPAQLTDYYNYLQKKYQSTNGTHNFKLLYLNPFNSVKPNESSVSEAMRAKWEEEEVYVHKDHSRHTIELFERWIALCKADKVRVFLRAFLEYLNHRINGEKFMGQHETVTKYVIRSAEHIEAAFKVITARNEILREIAEPLRSQLIAIAVSNTTDSIQIMLQDFEMDREVDRNHFTFSIKHSNLNQRDLWLRFEFNSYLYSDFFFGILTNGKRNSPLEIALNEALYQCDAEGADNNWAWWQYFKERQWTAETLYQLPSGKMAIEIGEVLRTHLPGIVKVLESEDLLLW
jgi:hypothetical protein